MTNIEKAQLIVDCYETVNPFALCANYDCTDSASVHAAAVVETMELFEHEPATIALIIDSILLDPAADLISAADRRSLHELRKGLIV